MNVIGRDNNVKKAFLAYPEFTEGLLGRLDDSVIAKAIPDEVLKNIDRVIITGNGDSYAASLATREINSRMFPNKDYHVLRCIDVSRHYIFPTEHPERTLVVVISVSGGGARVTEAMMRAAKKGCTTLAITGNPESRMAKEAKYVLEIQIGKAPEFSPAFQTRTYFTAVVTTTLFGLHAGLLNGAITPEGIAEQRQAILDYVKAICTEEVLTPIDDQIEALANIWKDYLGFDFVGGGSDFATAAFCSAKFFELCGSLNCLNDSEDWCHIDFFQTKRDQLGTIAIASKNCASFTRSVETIASMQKSSRNVLVVSDCGPEAFHEGVTVATLPKARFDHINPLLNYIPIFMLGNYICIKRGYEYFGGMGASNPLFSQDAGINTIKSSNVEYVD